MTAKKALELRGVGAGASCLLAGSLQVHEKLETLLTEFKCKESALVFFKRLCYKRRRADRSS